MIPEFRRAVFLDRDGVINRAVVRNGKSYPPETLDEFELLPGAAQAIQALHKAGFLIIVVTNQPDVATGVQSREIVEAMHEKLRALVPCDDIKVCYHGDSDDCQCRKPKPGMLLNAAREWKIDLARSFMVGDRWKDVEAGAAAGCATLFIDYEYAERRPVNPGAIVGSLAEASSLILREINLKGFR